MNRVKYFSSAEISYMASLIKSKTKKQICAMYHISYATLRRHLIKNGYGRLFRSNGCMKPRDEDGEFHCEKCYKKYTALEDQI